MASRPSRSACRRRGWPTADDWLTTTDLTADSPLTDVPGIGDETFFDRLAANTPIDGE